MVAGDDGRDTVVCSRSRSYVGGSSLDTLEERGPSTADTVLLSFEHWTPTSLQPKGERIFDFGIDGFAVRDVDGDGRADVEVTIR